MSNATVTESASTPQESPASDIDRALMRAEGVAQTLMLLGERNEGGEAGVFAYLGGMLATHCQEGHDALTALKVSIHKASEEDAQ